MRSQGSADISASRPRALAICDRCGKRVNHDRLQWQWQFQGPQLFNIRLLVCRSCLDVPQEQLRTIVLPPDPVPIQNARPEFEVSNNNPLSGIGASPNWQLQQYGAFIGNLTGGGNLTAAFDSNINKPAWMCANNSISNSSFNNYIGVDWTGNVSNLNMPSSLTPPVLRHSLTGFTAYAPNDRGFLGSAAADYVIQGSQANTLVYGAWTTISSGTTAGTPGETISADCTGSQYQFHRLAFEGDQTNFVAVAQLQLSVAQVGEPVTAGSS